MQGQYLESNCKLSPSIKHIHQYSYKQKKIKYIFYFVELKYCPKKNIPPASDYYNLEVTRTTTQAAKHRTLTLQQANQKELKLINM